VKLEKFPVISPLTAMLVGILGAIDDHVELAALSPDTMVAGCQLAGKDETWAATEG
jgi:hypothetical protein